MACAPFCLATHQPSRWSALSNSDAVILGNLELKALNPSQDQSATS
jgi:hypothetical protein